MTLDLHGMTPNTPLPFRLFPLLVYKSDCVIGLLDLTTDPVDTAQHGLLVPFEDWTTVVAIDQQTDFEDSSEDLLGTAVDETLG